MDCPTPRLSASAVIGRLTASHARELRIGIVGRPFERERMPAADKHDLQARCTVEIPRNFIDTAQRAKLDRAANRPRFRGGFRCSRLLGLAIRGRQSLRNGRAAA